MNRLACTVLAAVLATAMPARERVWSFDALRPDLDEKIATLDNLVFHEQIARYTQVGNRICRLDTFDALVDIVGGSERYSEVRRNDVGYSNVSQLDGVWSFGETVTMLRTTRDALSQRILRPGQPEPGSAEPEFNVEYRYSAGDQRWFLTLGSKTYWLDFEASVRSAPRTNQIQSIAWTSSPLPPETGISRITWRVDFHAVEIAGRVCTVPRTAVYRIERTGRGHPAEWNVAEFSARGRYGSETTVRFEP